MVLELERPPTAADASRGAPTGAATVAARVTGGGVGCGGDSIATRGAERAGLVLFHSQVK